MKFSVQNAFVGQYNTPGEVDYFLWQVRSSRTNVFIQLLKNINLVLVNDYFLFLDTYLEEFTHDSECYFKFAFKWCTHVSFIVRMWSIKLIILLLNPSKNVENFVLSILFDQHLNKCGTHLNKVSSYLILYLKCRYSESYSMPSDTCCLAVIFLCP